ncbi:MAG: hypothetical protein AUG51_21515 [Acidobacteria bacterium 13_1_20CM_3_53_8]|nr:MAG: hypothetical protein AUG51_21515 [Acidobacteria bacterium 13_1_20CM_3_53_8]
MSLTLYFDYSPRIELPYINEDEAMSLGQGEKGWSFSYVYYFSEIRDVYLALRGKRYEGKKDFKKAFTRYCLSIDLPFESTPWNERRILEHLNALKNFSLVDKEYRIIKQVFNNSKIGDPVSEDDLSIFREIYFSYFRFKEIFSWFINLNPPSRLSLVNQINKGYIKGSSRPLFAFSERGRLKDTFFSDLKDDVPLYYIKYKDEYLDENGNEDLMRFWDVFIKWGSALNLIEHFNLKRDLDIKTSSDKGIVCCYIISEEHRDFNILDYVSKNYENNYLYLPELVFRIATEFRWSIQRTQQVIMDQYSQRKELFSIERTSEIFIKTSEIKDEDKILFPKYNDAYISHMVVGR